MEDHVHQGNNDYNRSCGVVYRFESGLLGELRVTDVMGCDAVAAAELSRSVDRTPKTADKPQSVDDGATVSTALATTTANSHASLDSQQHQQQPEAGCCCTNAGLVY